MTLPENSADVTARDDPTTEEVMADVVAAAFHAAYEDLAPQHGYETREASRKPWGDVPENNRALMRAVVLQLWDHGIITPGRNV